MLLFAHSDPILLILILRNSKKGDFFLLGFQDHHRFRVEGARVQGLQGFGFRVLGVSVERALGSKGGSSFL